MSDADASVKDRLLDAALPHVPFDGWSEATFRRAIGTTGIDPAEARMAYPRGAVDLALAYHARGDDEMRRRIRAENMADLRFRDKVARAVRLRIEAIDDKEAARRGATLFSLPIYSADGARAIWSTADAIWTALGDPSDDVNWYTKRATLSGVYASTLLYWLGDDSMGAQDTWSFLDRRIDGVMQIERLKGTVRDNRVLSRLFAPANWALSRIKAPPRMPPMDVPGGFGRPPSGPR